MTEIERHDFDVVIIGAGGAGLRARNLWSTI
jgi:succinate dehydrogenase/fumarate reductase flavoprotein subunit